MVFNHCGQSVSVQRKIVSASERERRGQFLAKSRVAIVSSLDTHGPTISGTDSFMMLSFSFFMVEKKNIINPIPNPPPR